jgi:hypothetical protein
MAAPHSYVGDRAAEFQPFLIAHFARWKARAVLSSNQEARSSNYIATSLDLHGLIPAMKFHAFGVAKPLRPGTGLGPVALLG